MCINSTPMALAWNTLCTTSMEGYFPSTTTSGNYGLCDMEILIHISEVDLIIYVVSSTIFFFFYRCMCTHSACVAVCNIYPLLPPSRRQQGPILLAI